MTIAPHPRRPGRKRKPAPIILAAWQGPTPERLRHAEAAGMMMVVDAYRTDAGEQTQLRRQRMLSPLERLWKAGVLDSGQYGAARRYQRDADLAAIVGPGQAGRYEAITIQEGSGRFLLPMEAAADYLMRMAAAQAACGPKARRMLDWLADEKISWRNQARQWFPHASEQWARISFQRILRSICWDLESHYRRRA